MLANAASQTRISRLKHCVRQQAGSYRVLRGIRGIAAPKAARTALRFASLLRDRNRSRNRRLSRSRIRIRNRSRSHLRACSIHIPPITALLNQVLNGAVTQ